MITSIHQCYLDMLRLHPQKSKRERARQGVVNALRRGLLRWVVEPVSEAEGLVGRETMRWNVTTILHRMQGVIREFLRYHGYEVGRWLEAVPESSWEQGEGPQDFGVRVRMHPEVLMGEGYGVVPGREEVARAEEALGWVLWALFADAEEIGLKAPPFW